MFISVTIVSNRDHESIAEKIRRFVDINKIRDKWLEREAASDSYLDDNDSSTDDDFEKVDPSQITEDYEKNDDNWVFWRSCFLLWISWKNNTCNMCFLIKCKY